MFFSDYCIYLQYFKSQFQHFPQLDSRVSGLVLTELGTAEILEICHSGISISENESKISQTPVTPECEISQPERPIPKRPVTPQSQIPEPATQETHWEWKPMNKPITTNEERNNETMNPISLCIIKFQPNI